MAIKVEPNEDVEPSSGDDANSGLWDASGDDPAFLINFGFIRDPYLVTEIVARNAHALDPKVYVNKGQGFREEDAILFAPARRFVIKADIGRIGTICSLRIDPCSGAGSFSFDVKSFSSGSAAEAYMASLLAKGGAERVDLENLPRYWLKIPKLSWARMPLVSRYADASYKLAAALEATPHEGDAPWLSIVVPVYNASKRYLEDLVRSFEVQDQQGVELILSDDGSTSAETRQWLASARLSNKLKLVLNAENGGIAVATNAGLLHAKGDWVTFLDHDDIIAPFALKVIRKALDSDPGAAFLYTDELVVDDNLKPTGAMLKPAYDSVLLTGVNYINHFSVYRRRRLEEIGFLREGFDGSQDYDLLLRYLEGEAAERVLHLPYPAYWWRRTGTTYSRAFIEKATANGRKAIRDRFLREGKSVRVEPALTETLHRPVFEDTEKAWSKVSIIIPSKNSFPLISRILQDIFENTDYPHYEVIVVDNGSSDREVLELYKEYRTRHPNFRAEIVEEAFNFSRSINRGIKLSDAEHFLILNNDVEVIEAEWLKEMVSCLRYENTGIVGAKLLFPNENIQHAGVIMGFGGLAGHWYLNKPGKFGGPMNRLHVRNSMTCVTGAVMLISGQCWRKVGAWDEERFAVAYNDVDYCMRAYKAGFRIIWTPFACLRHHESLSRGAEAGKEKRQRFEREKGHLRTLHQTMDFQDLAINPNFSRDRSTPRIVVPQILHPVRAGICRTEDR